MPQPQYVSPWEAAVGNFLNSYAAMKGLQLQQNEAADRRRQSKRADQMARIQMNEAGYDELQMPTIESPPGQSVVQKIGRFLSGPEQPDSIVMKTHPSTREGEIAGAQQFETGRDQARFGNDRAVAELQGAIQARLDANRQAHEDARNAADNSTRLQVAGMEKGARREVLNAGLRDAFFDQAVAAAEGDPVRAQTNVGTYQMGQAIKFRASRADYYAAAARYRDRKAELTREGIAARTPFSASLDASLAANLGVKAPPPPAGRSGPPGRAASGDIVLPATATQNPSQPRALTPREKAMAQHDSGFRAWLVSQGYSESQLAP